MYASVTGRSGTADTPTSTVPRFRTDGNVSDAVEVTGSLIATARCRLQHTNLVLRGLVPVGCSELADFTGFRKMFMAYR